MQVAAHHRWPTGFERQFAFHHRAIDLGQSAVISTPYDGGVDAGKRLAHRARLHIHRREVGDHDAAGFSLPPVVVEGLAECLLAPDDRLRIEWLADARQKPQRRKIEAAHRLRPKSHHHADRGRCSVPDGDTFALQDAIPRRGVELRLGDDAGHAVGQRCDDAIAGTGDPTRIGGAPEDVVIMQIESIQTRDVMGNDRRMHMDRTLGPAGRAAGEMEQSAIFGRGRRNDEVRALGVNHPAPIERAGEAEFISARLRNQNHVLEHRQPGAQLFHLTAI